MEQENKDYKNEETVENLWEEETQNEKTSDEEEATSEEALVEGEKPSIKNSQEKEEREYSAEELKAQRDRLYARLKKKEKELELLKKQIEKEGSKKSPLQGRENRLEDWKAKVDFILANKDITEEEFEHLATVALRKSGEITFESLTEAKKSEAPYLNFLREKVAEKKKIPASTSGGVSSLEKKITPGMSQEEIDKILKERFERAMKSQKTGI